MGISCAYDVCMETNTHTTDFTTYKGVTILNIRNAQTNSAKIMSRDIAITYTADKWFEGGNGTYATTSIKKAHAIIEWLIAHGATVVDGRIVTTMGDMETCIHGCKVRGISGYYTFIK
jgi:hypothetical protein